MLSDLINILPLIATSASVIAVIVAIVTLRQNLKTRRLSVSPLLLPTRIKEFTTDDNLFACNYEYPITDEIGFTALVHFGIKNIGKGPAKNVHVQSFNTERDSTDVFRVGYNVISIPEGEAIPFVIRIAKKKQTDYFYDTYSTSIYYENILGNKLYLSVRLWIQEDGVVVLEYTDKVNPQWKPFISTVSREIESYGYFEMKNLEKKMKQGNTD